MTDKYIEYIKAGRAVSVGFLRLAILDITFGLTKGKRPFSCFAGTHGGILMSSGEFYPCARFASKKLMKMDENYNFQYYQEKFNPKTMNKCENCDIRQVCNAGCSYSQVTNGNKPLASICELFHMINEEAMRVVEECRDEKTFAMLIKMWLSNVG
jgi:radical SAM protein with 4Fe4S-binding SPASM domain